MSARRSPRASDRPLTEAAGRAALAALADAWAALSDSERDGFTDRAVQRLRTEAPQVFAWYQGEVADGKVVDEMRPSVRTTLRSYQYEEMGRRL